MLTPVESKVTRYEAGEAAPTTKANDRRKKGNQLAELMPPGTVDSGHEEKAAYHGGRCATVRSRTPGNRHCSDSSTLYSNARFDDGYGGGTEPVREDRSVVEVFGFLLSRSGRAPQLPACRRQI